MIRADYRNSAIANRDAFRAANYRPKKFAADPRFARADRSLSNCQKYDSQKCESLTIGSDQRVLRFGYYARSVI